MNWFLFDKLKVRNIKKFFLKSGAISVRIPLYLNIAGNIYHFETNMISNDILYLKIYANDLDFLPSIYSHIILFMNIDLFSYGKIELEGKLVAIDKLIGNRLGLWISYKAETNEAKNTISDFVRIHYSPRYSVRFEVDIKTELKYFQAEAINLSERGLFIEASPSQLEERQICELQLYPENYSISVNAEVSWINNGKLYDKPNGYGLKFIHNRISKSKISNYLTYLKNRSEILR